MLWRMSVDTHEEDRQMPTPGQPELYNLTYSDLARDYCLVGATNEVLADYFGVSRVPSRTGSRPTPTSPTRCARAAL
jgi:hypothetical protein